MTEPTFADGPPVPLLVEGAIDADTLRRLFHDLAAAAAVLAVREKGGPAEYAGGEGMPPAVALERLLSGTARAVQVRYRYDGREWTDTIIAAPAGFRVIRCRHEEA